MNPSGLAPWGGKATTLKAIKHLLKNAPIPITSSLVYSSLNRNKNIKINKEIKYINLDSLVKSIFNQMNWLDDHISQKSNVIPLLLTFLSFKRKYLLRVLEIWNGLRRLFTENLKEGMEWPAIVWIIGIPGRGGWLIKSQLWSFSDLIWLMWKLANKSLSSPDSCFLDWWRRQFLTNLGVCRSCFITQLLLSRSVFEFFGVVFGPGQLFLLRCCDIIVAYKETEQFVSNFTAPRAFNI